MSCFRSWPRLGGEFLPRVDEGDLLYMPTTQPGVPPEQAALQLFWQDFAMSKFDEVATVFGKVGRADTGTDPAPYSMAETTIRLRPRDEWPKIPRARWYSSWAPAPLQRVLRLVWPDATPRTTAELVDELDEAASLPGWTSAWTAPARARMDMMATGVRTPVGVRVIRRTRSGSRSSAAPCARVVGARARHAQRRVRGGRAARRGSRSTPTPPRSRASASMRRRCATIVDSFATGGQLGEIQGDRGRPLRVRDRARLPDCARAGPPISCARSRCARRRAGRGRRCRWRSSAGPTYVRRPGGAAHRARRAVRVRLRRPRRRHRRAALRRARAGARSTRPSPAASSRLGPGERIEWTGQYELLVAGKSRLAWIVPIVLLSMLGLLLLQFRSLTEALLVLASVPFALVGSFWTLYLLGYPLSAPVWVGLLSVVGLAMQTGVMMVVYIDEAFYRRVREGRLRSREDIVAAHAEGTVQRLRPKIMTVATMAASLLPLLWADGAGAEIMRRVAAPMLGGLATSAFLTLEVLPVLYTIWRHRQLRRALALGVPIASIVGPGAGRPPHQRPRIACRQRHARRRGRRRRSTRPRRRRRRPASETVAPRRRRGLRLLFFQVAAIARFARGRLATVSPRR